MTEISAMSWRSMHQALRSPDALIVTVLLPVALLVLMTVVFGGAVAPRSGDYARYVTPGVVALCLAYGASQTALIVAMDVRQGIIDRFRTMGTLPGSPLVGHIVVSVAKNLVASALVLATAAILGVRFSWSARGVVAMVAVAVAVTIAMAALATVVGLAVSSPEAAAGMSFVMLFLPYASSAFVPVSTLPEWLRGFAQTQPFTPITDVLRSALFDGTFDLRLGTALLWADGILGCSCVGIAALWARRSR